ncbi:MAG: S9 family peptidase, partial [Allosphingosinicella sp.]
MSLRFRILTGVAVLAGAASIGTAQGSAQDARAQTKAPAQTAAAPADDPHVWLEEIQGERALAWARAESQRTLSAFQADPRYQSMYDRALEILQARDRIPYVQMRADGLYNFWQDETNVRGLVRRTNLASYRTDQPDWESVLDIDALARTEGKSWVYQGMQCLPPEQTRCLVSLSDGGRDANVVREFDTTRLAFVDGGFNIPEGKQDISWEDRDTVLIARDWGPGTITESGYPFVIKRLRRGQSLDQAVEVFRGTANDVGAAAYMLRDSAGTGHGIIAQRNVDAFRSKFTLIRPGGNIELDLPERSGLLGIVDGRVLAQISEPWAPSAGLNFKTDSIVSYDLAAW